MCCKLGYCHPHSSYNIVGKLSINMQHTICAAPPTVSSLTYDCSTRTLNCTSTDSPATTVTWTRDGDTLTVDGTTYSMTQTVTDRRTSTYENVLTLPATADITGNYHCLVRNALEDSQMTINVMGKMMYDDNLEHDKALQQLCPSSTRYSPSGYHCKWC